MRAFAAAVAVSSLVGACVVAPAPPYPGGGVVMVAPPAPVVEDYGVAPGPGYIWIGGYWNWAGGSMSGTGATGSKTARVTAGRPTGGIRKVAAGARSRAVGNVADTPAFASPAVQPAALSSPWAAAFSS